VKSYESGSSLFVYSPDYFGPFERNKTFAGASAPILTNQKVGRFSNSPHQFDLKMIKMKEELLHEFN